MLIVFVSKVLKEVRKKPLKHLFLVLSSFKQFFLRLSFSLGHITQLKTFHNKFDYLTAPTDRNRQRKRTSETQSKTHLWNR